VMEGCRPISTVSGFSRMVSAYSVTARILGFGKVSHQVTVADDGAGFVPGVAPERVGLANVRARVEHAGGTWHLHAEPGAGTVISMEVSAR